MAEKCLVEKNVGQKNWPKKNGGTDWSPTKKYILQNELAVANTPIIIPFGVSMCGPVVYTFGTDTQKRQHLPGILNSDWIEVGENLPKFQNTNQWYPL